MKCIIGFDGYVDKMAHIVKKRENASQCVYYSQITDFSKKIHDMAGLSGDLEVSTFDKRYGGNAPIMAGALATLGEEVALASPIGTEECFNPLKSKCKIYNLGEPASSLNIEFQDGKVMLGEISVLNDISINSIREFDFYDDMMSEFLNSYLIAFCNWSQMENILPIYESILLSDKLKSQICFFDLADISKKSKESVEAFLALIKKASDKIRIIIGLNENESVIMGNFLNLEKSSDKEKYIIDLSGKMNCSIVVHGRDYSAFSDGKTICMRKGKLVAEPVISTGGGDHFNAGFCYGIIKNMEIGDILDFAMGTSGAFVSSGVSPDVESVKKYLK